MDTKRKKSLKNLVKAADKVKATVSINGKELSKQTVLNLQTGELEEVDADETGFIDEDDEQENAETVRQSQAKIIATLTGIVMKPSNRVWALKVNSQKMIDELTRIYKNQKSFILKFKVPTSIEKGIVKSWEEVEFETRLRDLNLKGGTATCHGDINHNGACLMSELINNWKSESMEFYLDGIQQSIF